MPITTQMPLFPGPRPPYLEGDVRKLKSQVAALELEVAAAESRASAAEARAAAAEAMAAELEAAKVDRTSVVPALSSGTAIGSVDGRTFYAPSGGASSWGGSADKPSLASLKPEECSIYEIASRLKSIFP